MKCLFWRLCKIVPWGKVCTFSWWDGRKVLCLAFSILDHRVCLHFWACGCVWKALYSFLSPDIWSLLCGLISASWLRLQLAQYRFLLSPQMSPRKCTLPTPSYTVCCLGGKCNIFAKPLTDDDCIPCTLWPLKAGPSLFWLWVTLLCFKQNMINSYGMVLICRFITLLPLLRCYSSYNLSLTFTDLGKNPGAVTPKGQIYLPIASSTLHK